MKLTKRNLQLISATLGVIAAGLGFVYEVKNFQKVLKGK